MLQAGHFAERRRLGDGGAVELALGDREQRIVNQRRFAGAGHAGDAGKQTDRQRQRHVLQVVAARAAQLQHLGRIGLHALRRNGDLALAAENWPVSESGCAMMSSTVPSATTWPPCTPAPGPMSIT